MPVREKTQAAGRPVKRKVGAKGLDRDSVLRIAIRIADEVGVSNLSLKRLAEEAGVAPPSIYTHFGSLADVKWELTLRAYATLVSRATAEALGKAGAEAVTAVCFAYRSFAHESPGLHSALASTHDVRAAHAWVDLLYRVLSQYQLSTHGQVHATRAMRSLLYGFASMEQQGNFSLLDTNRDETFRLLVEGFVVSLQRFYETA